MERFLYRLAKSAFADQFVLKGALLLTAWKAPVTRPAIDIDLAGRTSNELEHIRSVVTGLCQLNAEPDGLEFDPASIVVQRIKEDAEYEGVRVRFNAALAKARIPMQIDIGFGDVIVPKPVEVEYPAMLEFPPPVLRAYPKETVVAEKLEALTVLGMLNSRIKSKTTPTWPCWRGCIRLKAPFWLKPFVRLSGIVARWWNPTRWDLRTHSVPIRPERFNGAPLFAEADSARSGSWRRSWSRCDSSP